MKIGYARCSTLDQNPARQEELLKAEGCEKIYLDMLSGKDMNRPQLKEMLEFIREGDVVIVESISRLARNTKDLLTLIEEITKRKAQIISKKEKIDTSTPTGKFMLTVFGAVSELERDYIKERQAEGIAIAKREGKYRGRQPIHYDRYLFEELYKRMKAGDITRKAMAKRLNVSSSTLYRIIRRYEANNSAKSH
ncbi:MAG: recombinase family protein [Lactimicrobium massiliense]|nr:recombinase family protein [Lactimicrobium massiliense]MDD6727579.1 recombinase family protein [Lactimicrobium massiliense]